MTSHRTAFAGRKRTRPFSHRAAGKGLRLERLEDRRMLSQGDLILAGATWKFLDDGMDQGTAWQEVGFDDSLWESGPAELGYGDGDESTTITCGPDPNNKYPTYYFRHSFDVADPAIYENLTLDVVRDDGCVIYLNGTEVARSNMPEGDITYSTLSATVVGDSDESAWQTFTVDAERMAVGMNVVAVEVHQCNSTSTDLSFSLQLTGNLVPEPVPAVTLVSPADQSAVNSTQVPFTCSATDDEGLTNATLYIGNPPETVAFSGSAAMDDAQISADSADINYGSAISINIDGENPHTHAVIKFPDMFGDGPGQIPLESTIVVASAVLEINCTDSGDPLKIYRLTEDWIEGEVTWNNRAAGVPWTNAGADGLGSHAGVALDGYCTAPGTQNFDITQFVQEWIAGAANYGIVITDTGINGMDFDTSESGHSPMLTVTYGSPKVEIETQPLSGISDSATFTTTLADQQDYIWNCLITNSSGQQSWASSDFRLRVDSLSPDLPVLVAPTDGAIGVSTSPTLEIAVTDPGGDVLDVTFYGAGASLAEDFTIVVLPDTQVYSQSYPDIFTSQTQWIVDNRNDLNILFVTHEGDIVQNYSVIDEWERANTSMSLLDGVVPYGVLPGNHDQPTGNYNIYFPYTRYESKPWYGGHYGDTNDNNYQLFSAGGDDYVILHIGYDPDSAVIAWADSVLETHADRMAIITTHSYLNTDGSRTTPGNTIWNDLVVPNPNVHFVLCGHMHDEYTRIDVANGHNVYQLLADYQEEPNGGNGFLRTMRFSPSNDTVYVETYSPWLNQHQTDADSQFAIEFDMAGFSVIGTVAGVPSGSNASMTWSDLEMGTQYEWYATVTDPTGRTATGPVWSFTTGVNLAPVANDDTAETNENAPVQIDVLANDSDPENDPLTINLLDSTHGTAAVNGNNTVDFTPTPDFNGTASFTYQVNDGLSDSNVATVSITVVGINDPPTAVNDTANTNEDTPVTIDVLANDRDPENDPLTINLLGSTNGAAVVNGNNTVDFTPELDLNGTASFTYQVYDGQLYSDIATVTIHVAAVNDAPVFIKGADQEVLEDAVAQTVPGWATGISAGPEDELAQMLSFNVSNDNPTLFAVQPAISADGTFTYTPAENANGWATITVTLSDNGGTDNGGLDTSSPETATITITPVNDAPTVAQPIGSVTVNEDAADEIMYLTGEMGVFDDVDILTNADSLLFDIIENTNPSLLSASVIDDILTLDFLENQHGIATVRVRATDIAGDSVEDEFSVTVSSVNDAPVVVNPIPDVAVDPGTVQTDIDLSGVFNDADIATDSDTLTLSVSNNDNDALVTAEIVGNTLTLTYAADQSGTANVTVRATDKNDAYVEDTLQVTVKPAWIDNWAVSETTASGSVTGSLANTYVSDDSYEAIKEVQYAGNRSRLEHTWQFDVTGGEMVTFHLEAWHDSAVENFVFDYSTDGVNWTTMLTVSKTSDDGQDQTYALPAGTIGTVLVRVTDTDRSKEPSLDTVFIDAMVIRCADAGGNELPVVTIAATDDSAAELGSDAGTFTVTRTGTTGDLTVSYTVGGTATADYDYATLSGSVTIPNGSASATITVSPVDDTLYEGDETVTVTLATGESYTIGAANTDTVTILDNDPAPLPVVTILATDASAAEAGSDPGTFTVTRTGTTGDLTVNYTVVGTATAGDYSETLTGSVTIPDGSASATITVTPVDDLLYEGNETVTVTLTADDPNYMIGAANTGTVTILDDDTAPLPEVTIAATDASASEEGSDPGTFTVTRTDTTGALTVYYAVGGTAAPVNDYATLAGSVTIPDGNASATITVSPVDDSLYEGAETVTVTLADSANYTIGVADSDTVTIVDNDNTTTNDAYAIGETTVEGSVVGGDLNNLQGNDDTSEAIQETIIPRGKGKSQLEHVWTFDVTGGESVTFYVDAHHNADSVEDFEFQYSIDGVNWISMLTVTKTEDDNIYQTFELPASTSGIVYVRVIDTNRANGETTQDTIYIDDMFIRSE